jgi:hypothetical protein
MITSRRSFLAGLTSALVAAPAIVQASSLMPVRGIVMPVEKTNRLFRVTYVAFSGRMTDIRGTEILDTGAFADFDKPCLAVHSEYCLSTRHFSEINVGDISSRWKTNQTTPP